MRYNESIEELTNRRGYGIKFKERIEENISKFKKIEWDVVAYLSTKSAYKWRSSEIVKQFTEE